ncbi:MAG: thioesterase family protein [Candidatus Zixiibacteriota bacterium]
MFLYRTTVRLHHTDAAGLLFFAEQFRLSHDAYETFMESVGFPFAPLIRHSEFLLPIVHCEADFKAPLMTGDKLLIQVKAERVGETSFTLSYTLLKNDQELVGTAKTVHALISRTDGQKRPIDGKLRAALEGIQD